MSGHSKWSTIKRKKGALDAKRSKMFSRVRIKDEFFPAGLDAIYRLVATNVTAGETQGEKVTLTLSIKTV